MHKIIQASWMFISLIFWHLFSTCMRFTRSKLQYRCVSMWYKHSPLIYLRESISFYSLHSALHSTMLVSAQRKKSQRKTFTQNPGSAISVNYPIFDNTLNDQKVGTFYIRARKSQLNVLMWLCFVNNYFWNIHACLGLPSICVEGILALQRVARNWII